MRREDADLVASVLCFSLGSFLAALSIFCIWRERFYVSAPGSSPHAHRLPAWSFLCRRVVLLASLLFVGRGAVIFGNSGATKAIFIVCGNVDIDLVMCSLAIVCFCYAEAVWQSMENGRFPRWSRLVFGALLVEHVLAPVISVVLASAFNSTRMLAIIYVNWLFFCSFLIMMMWGCYAFLIRFVSNLRASSSKDGIVGAPSQMLATADAATPKLRSFRTLLLIVSFLAAGGIVISITTLLRTLADANNEASARFWDTPTRVSTLDATLAVQALGISAGVWFYWVPRAPNSSARVQPVDLPASSVRRLSIPCSRNGSQQRSLPLQKSSQSSRAPAAPVVAWRDVAAADAAAAAPAVSAVVAASSRRDPDDAVTSATAAVAAPGVCRLSSSNISAASAATTTLCAHASPHPALRSPVRSIERPAARIACVP